ncbi:hypothetical protein [Microbacterium sp. Leaf320]|uniref:hypothetical protein n=1 Tax=Microbacterium sp. Leaf320 TaxID=1736334 RepID=UPI0006FD7E4A|nr:hypothetical protein [Microbacterium sp. Leaf320]KQQ65069.1 hypothetical protein ASF63_13950 [Microbacterium sp. Leaf320]
MKITFGIAAGITLSIVVYAMKQPTLDHVRHFLQWVFTRVEVRTHPDCQPRFRSWHKGVMTEGPW